MTYASPQEVGFCPHFDTFNWPVPHDRQRITVEGHVISFDPSKPIYVTRGLTGRCTSVFTASTRDDVTGRDRTCVLKLSYQPSRRIISEIDHYRLLAEKGIEGVPEILCAQKLSSLGDGPRGALMKCLPHYVFGPIRYLEAIVMADKYKPITSIDINKDTKLFFRIFLSIVETHHRAYVEAGILHRDIHTNNLMWGIEDGRPVGVLIDWDFASGPVSHPPEDPQQSAFTLNVAFLAVDLLQKECSSRFYRHDLESFFWVLWSIIISKVGIVDLDKFAMVSRWEQGNVGHRKFSKFAFLDRGQHDVLETLQMSKQTSLSHAGVTECLSALGDMISRGQNVLERRTQKTNVETADGHIVYTNFVAALKRAVE
ncbi:uncharacterized protein EI90DRAFT_82949 [Cantharellus anzutake]|uniref:uncharacterized protein n=1 Tax=Cantharellus anzutake TaxID=1750568 RepID=UPI0019039DC0|nr:uncharacterized protein EI90DRAFT_82949 [Cantharellus anzutake]KAF8336887.1 hypothetical protein EI90DRAFT_82949 [Cantharellus anzutake]